MYRVYSVSTNTYNQIHFYTHIMLYADYLSKFFFDYFKIFDLVILISHRVGQMIIKFTFLKKEKNDVYISLKSSTIWKGLICFYSQF